MQAKHLLRRERECYEYCLLAAKTYSSAPHIRFQEGGLVACTLRIPTWMVCLFLGLVALWKRGGAERKQAFTMDSFYRIFPNGRRLRLTFHSFFFMMDM